MTKSYRESLEDLRSRLEDANKEASDPELQTLHEDTHGTLGQDDHHTAISENTGFRGRLEAAIERYGASHPELTRAAQNVLDVLSANGL